MNIIEAIQAAESGKFIQNGIMKIMCCFLKYNGIGIFHKYEIIEGKAIFQHQVSVFNLNDVLSTSWETIDATNLTFINK